MANILYGDVGEEKTVFNDSRVPEAVIRNIYAATESRIAGYRKESNGSLFYYVLKYNARSAGYLSADFIFPAAPSPSAEFEKIKFHNCEEFEAQSQDASQLFKMDADFSDFQTNHYAYIIEKILNGVEQGNTVYIKLKDSYDNIESIEKELSFAKKILSVFPEPLQKEISFVCNITDNKKLSSNIAFIPEAVSMSGGTMIDCCNLNNFKECNKPYALYLAGLITGETARNNEAETFLNSKVSDKMLRNGNKIRNPFSALYGLFVSETYDDIEAYCGKLNDFYSNCLNDTTKNLFSEALKRNGLEMPKIQNEPSESFPDEQFSGTPFENTNINMTPAVDGSVNSEGSSGKVINDNQANAVNIGNFEQKSIDNSVQSENADKLTSVLENGSADVIKSNYAVDNGLVQTNENPAAFQNDYFEKKEEPIRMIKLNETIRTDLERESEQPEPQIENDNILKDDRIKIIIDQWEYFWNIMSKYYNENSEKLQKDYFGKDNFDFFSEKKYSFCDCILNKELQINFLFPESENQNGQGTNDDNEIIFFVFLYFVSLIVKLFKSIDSVNDENINDKIYLIASYSYLFDIIAESLKDHLDIGINKEKVEKFIEGLGQLINFDLSMVQNNYIEEVIRSYIDYYLILHCFGLYYKIYYGNAINDVFDFCSINLSKKECAKKMNDMINKIDFSVCSQAEKVKVIMKNRLGPICDKYYKLV